MTRAGTTATSTPGRPPPIGAGAGPTPAQVVRLQAARGYPAVSLLLTTRPAPRMHPDDAARLSALAQEAERRLREEGLPGVTGTILPALHELVAQAQNGPTGAAVAAFVSSATQALVRLPVPVVDRVVIDPTFATRDLVRSLHRTPRHVVLLLGAEQARLLDGAGGQLRAATTRAFPLAADGARTEDFLRRVDRALGTYRALHPNPLVLVGPGKLVAQFAALSRHGHRLAGTVSANVITASLPELTDRVRPVLEQYLLSRQEEALALLDRSQGEDRVVSGMRSVWLAARHERPQMLAVEEGLFYPARVSADGDWLTPADDVEHPEVLDDAVDELIEAVLDRGGWIAMVDDGALAAHERVALTLRAAR
jgi:Bacterial archaeo-eukaryotic release factor family 3